MYEHVRTVVWGLILSLVFTIGAGIVAVIDPFNNGVPWANWLAMSVAVIITVSMTTVIAAMTGDDEGFFWMLIAIAEVVWLLIGGFITGIVTGTDGLNPEYHPLAWTVFAIPLAVLPVSALVQYLVEASAQQQGSRSANIRRIA